MDRISHLAERLHTQRRLYAYPVRLLLLERQADDLFEKRLVGTGAGRSGEVLACRFDPTPLVVPELDATAVWALVRDCPWRDVPTRLTVPPEVFFTRLTELDAERRPLVAMILAEAAVTAPVRTAIRLA